MNVLIVEDEFKLASFLQKGLSEAGYHVQVSYDGYTAERIATQEDHDILIIDIMLPELNGFQLCKSIRAKGIKTPILILSALGSIDDKVEGFTCGADDYLVKPFHMKELLIRIEALTRRITQTDMGAPSLTYADLVLDINRKIATRAGREIKLTAKEYQLLELFMKNHDKVLSRTFIAEQVWGSDFDTTSNVVDVYVNYLRKKLERKSSDRLIHTLIGMGYIMKQK